MADDTQYNWIIDSLFQAREQKNHRIVEFLVENLHKLEPPTPQTLSWLAEAQFSLLKIKESWNTAQQALNLDSMSATARAICKTAEQTVRTYLLDDQPRPVHLVEAVEFIIANPTRGKSFFVANLNKSGAQRALYAHQLHDVMVVGGEGAIFDPASCAVFKNSFSSREQPQLDIMAIEPNLRLKTSGVLRISGLVAHLCGQWSGNFFHWMNELLPRVQLLQKLGFDGHYLTPFANHPFIRESFELLGVNSARLIRYDPFSTIRCDALITFDSLWFLDYIDNNLWLIEKLREALLAAAAPITPLADGAEGIYIERKGSRSVKNSVELRSILNRFKITPISAELLSLRDQIRLAAASKLLIGPHGSGLTLSLFMPKESTLVELLPVGFVNGCFAHILKALNHRHYTIPSVPKELENEHDRVEPYLPYIEHLLEREMS